MSSTTGSIIKNVAIGARTLLDSAKLVMSKKDLLGLSILPLLITIGIYLFTFHALFDFLGASIDERVNAWRPENTPWLETFVGLLAPLFKLVAALVLGLLGAVTFSFTTSIFCLPFNDFLAEKTENHILISSVPSQEKGKVAFLKHLWIDLWKTVIAGALSLLLFVLSWIPLVHFVTVPLLFILVTFPFISFAQTRRGIGVAKSFRQIFDFWPFYLGLGAVLSLGFAIPIISSIFLPLAVIAGTILQSRIEQSILSKSGGSQETAQ